MTALGDSMSVDGSRQVVSISTTDHESPVNVEMPIIPFTPQESPSPQQALYAVIPNGTAYQRLTYDVNVLQLPRFTADGTGYAYKDHQLPVLRPRHYDFTPGVPRNLPLTPVRAPLHSGYFSAVNPCTQQRLVLRTDGLWLEERDRRQARLLATGKIEKPSFSPDGAQITYLRDETLYAVECTPSLAIRLAAICACKTTPSLRTAWSFFSRSVKWRIKGNFVQLTISHPASREVLGKICTGSTRVFLCLVR